MRMWMVEPRSMCDKHLLGEHAETHTLAGTLARGRSIDGFVAKGLLEPGALASRHDALAAEMAARAFRHASPLAAPDTGYLSEAVRSAKVDTKKSARELVARCERCRSRVRDAGGRGPRPVAMPVTGRRTQEVEPWRS